MRVFDFHEMFMLLGHVEHDELGVRCPIPTLKARAGCNPTRFPLVCGDGYDTAWNAVMHIGFHELAAVNSNQQTV